MKFLHIIKNRVCALKGCRVDTNYFWKNVIECAIILLVVTLLACFIFSVPSFAVTPDSFEVKISNNNLGSNFTYLEGYTYAKLNHNTYTYNQVWRTRLDTPVYFFLYKNGSYYSLSFVIDEFDSSITSSETLVWYSASNRGGGFSRSNFSYNSNYQFYTTQYTGVNLSPIEFYCPVFNSLADGLSALRDFIDNPAPDYTKNPNVNVIVANTFISMGIEGTQSQLLTLADGYWEYMTDSENASSTRGDWDIQSVVNRWNMMSNAYKSLQLGYSISSDQLNSMRSFLVNEVISLVEVSVTENYWKAEYNGSVFTYDPNYGLSMLGSHGSSIAFTTGTKSYIYPDYITDSGILTSQLTLSPYAVRKFGGVADAPTIEQNPPSGGTGVITDQNGDTVYNIDIDFPSLDWLASAIQSILDFLHSLLDNITSLITRLIEAVENLLGDAFEGLQSFGQGIVEWIQTIIEALHDLMEEYIPSDIVGVLYTFMCLFIGVGLIKFVLGRL